MIMCEKHTMSAEFFTDDARQLFKLPDKLRVHIIRNPLMVSKDVKMASRIFAACCERQNSFIVVAGEHRYVVPAEQDTQHLVRFMADRNHIPQTINMADITGGIDFSKHRFQSAGVAVDIR